MSSSPRIVVIGAGITGTLTALELARAGYAVTVLEAAWIGAGSSSRTAAGIRQQFSTPGTVQGMRFSVAYYRRFTDVVQGDTCPIIQNGYLFLHADDTAWQHAKGRVEMQHGAGLTEVEALDHAEVTRRFDWVSPEAVIGATWCPTDGFLLPDVVYGEASRRAVELGAQLLQKAPVTGARHAGGRLVAVETPKGVFEADLFVDCTNAWTGRTATVLRAEALPVAPLKRYLWFLGRDGSMSAETLTGMPLTIIPSGTYVRPENPDTLMMGRKHPADPDPDFAYEDQDYVAPRFSHQTGIDAVPFELWMEVAEALPPIGEFAGIRMTTAGYYGATPDHNPFLGYDRQVPNLIRLVGFSGHGAMFGPFTARVARTLVEAGKDVDRVGLDDGSVTLTPFHIGRSYDAREVMVI